MQARIIQAKGRFYCGSTDLVVGMTLEDGRKVEKVNEKSFRPPVVPGDVADRESPIITLKEARRFGWPNNDDDTVSDYYKKNG